MTSALWAHWSLLGRILGSCFMQKDSPPAAQALSHRGREDGNGVQYNTSCKMLNEISTPTAYFLSLCGKGNVNEHKDHVNQTAVYLQIASYPGVQIPSATPYRQLWWGSLDLKRYPPRFKQTRPHARHLIQISYAQELFKAQYNTWVSKPRTWTQISVI